MPWKFELPTFVSFCSSDFNESLTRDLICQILLIYILIDVVEALGGVTRYEVNIPTPTPCAC